MNKALKARIVLWNDASLAFWSYLALSLEPVERTDIPTTATDGEHFYFNPDFWDKCSIQEQKALFVHEVYHCVFRDFDPEVYGHRNEIVTDDMGNPISLWNIASDLKNNLDIVDMGLTLPQGALIDQKWRGFSKEQVYDELLKQAKKNGKAPKACSCGCRLMPPKPGKDGESQAQRIKALAAEWKQKTLEAAVMAKEAGSLPAGFEGLIGAQVPKIDPFHVIRHWLGNRCKTDYFWHPPSRRYLSMGLYLPRLGGNKLKLCFVCDTSGSMSGSEGKLLGELRLLKARYRVEVDVYCVDTDVYGPTRFGIHDSIPETLKFQGGGGTNLQAAIDKIAESGDEYDGIIILTDGYTYPEPVQDKLFKPTLWVMVRQYGEAHECAAWGDKVKVDFDGK